MTNHGLILQPRHPEDFVFGSNRLGDVPINAGGQWLKWTPDGESQAQNPFEPFCCVSEATDNAFEILIHKEFGESPNYSDRWLATASGTKARQGNDPKTVAETLRKKGNVQEQEYPFTAATYDEFYQTLPQSLYPKALALPSEFDIGYEWVGSDPDSLMAALEYSPVTAAVYAWQFDEQSQRYIRPKGGASFHDVCIVGYEPNNKWLILDSYPPFIKELAWDFGFEATMRFTLHRASVRVDLLTKLLAAYQQLLALLQAQLKTLGVWNG